jgi:uncharacterized protein DUF6597/helix-turn-helix protein
VVTLDQAGWNRGMLVLLPPPAPLAKVVEFFWIDERTRHSPRAHEWRIVADGAAHVIYSRAADQHGTEYHRLHVVGARSHYVDVDCSSRLLTVGARLRPGALPALFRISARELTNRSVPAEWLVRRPAHAALAHLEIATRVHVASCLASFIGDLTARGRPLDPRAVTLRSGSLGTDASEARILARTFGVGERALRSWCIAHLGLGLKRFLRIGRLHQALEHRLQAPATTWTSIAAASGFADQPHLVRDCRALLGESPGEFFARAG